MTAEIFDLLVRVNLAFAAGAALVLMIRTPTRLWFGARVAYALWLIPLAAAAACFLPQRIEMVTLFAAQPLTPPAPLALPPASAAPGVAFDAIALLREALSTHLASAVVTIWLSGAAFSLLVLGLRQRRFVRALGKLAPRRDWGARVFGAQTSAAGPAVIGVLAPKIIVPADFDARYSAEERRYVIAHERAHIRQGDPLINGATALIQALGWFNPLVHVGAAALRVDQELACDAAVLAEASGARRAYAEAMLKSQVGDVAPLGCAWPPASIEVLKERISMLKSSLPSKRQSALGAAAIAMTAAAVCGAAWASQPPRTVTVIERRVEREVERDIARAEDDLARAEAELAAAQHDFETEFTLELEGGEHGMNADEIREEVRRAVEEARAEIERRRADIAAHAREIAQSEDERARYQAEAHDIAREAIEEARRALADEGLEIELSGDVTPEVMELQVAAQSLARHALMLAAAAMDDRAPNDAEMAAIEVEMQASAERIAQLALSVGADAQVRASHRVRIETRNADAPPAPSAPASPAAPVAPPAAPAH